MDQNAYNRPKFSYWLKMLTLKVLEAHFHQPLKEVADHYGLCITFLKRVCRARGIKYWPSRKVAQIQKQQKMMGDSTTQVTSDVISAFKREEETHLKKRVSKVKQQRIPVWDREKKRKLAGMAAPLECNLARYLRDHPTCEVYQQQEDPGRSRHKRRRTMTPSSQKAQQCFPSPSLVSTPSSSATLGSLPASPLCLPVVNNVMWPGALLPSQVLSDPKTYNAHQGGGEINSSWLPGLGFATPLGETGAPWQAHRYPLPAAAASQDTLGSVVSVLDLNGPCDTCHVMELEEACLDLVNAPITRTLPEVQAETLDLHEIDALSMPAATPCRVTPGSESGIDCGVHNVLDSCWTPSWHNARRTVFIA